MSSELEKQLRLHNDRIDELNVWITDWEKRNPDLDTPVPTQVKNWMREKRRLQSNMMKLIRNSTAQALAPGSGGSGSGSGKKGV